MANTKAPTAPPGVGAAGRRLWRAVADAYGLEDHELALLTQAARTADVIAALDKEVAAKGVVLTTEERGPVVNPAVAEARQQRLVLGRLLAQLRLPDAGGERPQARGGFRGYYSRQRERDLRAVR